MPINIFVWRNNEESGPLSRAEVFARLQNGELDQADFARTEEMDEWHPLIEVLKDASSSTFFSLEQIAAVEETIVTPRAVFDSPLRSSPPLEVTIPREVSPKRIFALAGAGILLVIAVSYLVLRNETRNRVPLASVSAGENPATRGDKPPDLTPWTSVESNVSDPMTSLSEMGLKSDATSKRLIIGEQRLLNQKAIVSATPAATDPIVLIHPEDANEIASLTKPENLQIVRNETLGPVKAATEPEDDQANPNITAPAPRIAARQVTLPIVKDIWRSALWVADTDREPRAALVLVIGYRQNARGLANDEKWQQFARDNRLALAVIAFDSDSKLLSQGRGFYRAEEGAGEALLEGVGRAFGRKLPIILNGRSVGAVFVASLALWKPDRFLFWSGYTNEWPTLPPTGQSQIAGIVACDKEELVRNKEANMFFTKGRVLDYRWTWLSLGIPIHERQAKFDSFFCEYARAVLASDSRKTENVGAWMHIERKDGVAAAERLARPAAASWLPNAGLANLWCSLSGEEVTTSGKRLKGGAILQKVIVTKNPRQPQLNMYLRLPSSMGEKKASGVFSFCTYDNNEQRIISNLEFAGGKRGEGVLYSSLITNIVAYAEAHDMAVLTWGTVEAWNNRLNTDELLREQQKEFDRNFDFLANAWERGVTEFAKETGIPTKNFLLYGTSRGAQWAHRLALRKPDYFLAVHLHIPSTFDQPVPEANRPLWLLTTGEMEYGYERAQRFYAECQALGYPIIFKAIVGLGHKDSSMADALGLKFFDYALTVKDLREAYEQERANPFSRAKTGSPKPWLKTFEQPEFFGDIVNQECVPIGKVEMIPKPFRVPLPTKVLADAWNQ